MNPANETNAIIGITVIHMESRTASIFTETKPEKIRLNINAIITFPVVKSNA